MKLRIDLDSNPTTDPDLASTGFTLLLRQYRLKFGF